MFCYFHEVKDLWKQVSHDVIHAAMYIQVTSGVFRREKKVYGCSFPSNKLT